MISPVSPSSLARPKPTSLTSREQPPTPGIRPRLFSGSPKRAERAATLRSHAMASSSPPPTQVPLIAAITGRSEEHTSELQSRLHLVCRLLLEKKKKKSKRNDKQ